MTPRSTDNTAGAGDQSLQSQPTQPPRLTTSRRCRCHCHTLVQPCDTRPFTPPLPTRVSTVAVAPVVYHSRVGERLFDFAAESPRLARRERVTSEAMKRREEPGSPSGYRRLSSAESVGLSQVDGSVLICGPALEGLDMLPDRSVRTVVTSPPYWSLRDYKADGQIGRDDALGAYLKNIVVTFDKLRRALRRCGDGTPRCERRAGRPPVCRLRRCRADPRKRARRRCRQSTPAPPARRPRRTSAGRRGRLSQRSDQRASADTTATPRRCRSRLGGSAVVVAGVDVEGEDPLGAIHVDDPLVVVERDLHLIARLPEALELAALEVR